MKFPEFSTNKMQDFWHLSIFALGTQTLDNYIPFDDCEYQKYEINILLCELD